jgi:hypothetical protein
MTTTKTATTVEDRYYLRDEEDCIAIVDGRQGELIAYVRSTRVAVEAVEALNRGEDFDFAMALT